MQGIYINANMQNTNLNYDFLDYLRKTMHLNLQSITDYIAIHAIKHRSQVPGRIEEQLTIHPHLPAKTFECVRHPNKHNVVHSKHKHQHKRGFCKLPEQREIKMFYELKGLFTQKKYNNLLTLMQFQTCMNFAAIPLYNQFQKAKFCHVIWNQHDWKLQRDTL